MIGQIIGHYQILEEIGQGGMGVVYKAVDTKLNRPVAIKSLKVTAGQDDIASQRFMREALTVARLDHPYICKLYEILEHNGTTYMVLEYVRGRSLSEVIAGPDQPMSLEKVVELGREIAEALEEAHKNGVVHRDIKPQNIMVLESGHVKILDFGLAKAVEKPVDSDTTIGASLTAAGMVLGTLTHMSPEQLAGLPVDTRSDIFSFGVTLYELIAGRLPFSGRTQAELAAAIIREEFEPLHRFRRGVPENLARVIGRMLEKDPAERYQSVHEVWVELRRIREELISQNSRAKSSALPVAAPRSGETSAASESEPAPAAVASPSIGPAQPILPGPAGRRRRLPVLRLWRWRIGFASALTAVALALVFWFQSSRPVLSFAVRDWVLVSDFENLTGDSIFDRSLATALNVSLSQSTHANVFSKSRTNEVLQRMGKKPDSVVDEHVGREICQRENIRGLICPSIGKIGNRFVLTAKIVDPETGDGVRSYGEQADDYNDVISAMDKIAASLRKGLGESLTQVRTRSRPLAQVTTASLSALKSYSDAQQLWRKGEYKSALDLDLEAVKKDPDFAMAHAALGTYYLSYIFNDVTNGKLHYEKALKLVDRATEREKQVIRLQYESHFGTFETTRNLYEMYLRDYPDSIVQRYNYAGDLRDHQMIDKAIEQYKELLRIAPDYSAAHINLATCYSGIASHKDALESYARAFKLQPNWLMDANINREYGLVFVRLGDITKARDVYTKIFSTGARPTALRSMALLDLYQGKYRDAKQKLDEALLLNVSQKALLNEGRNHLFMSILLGGRGDQTGATRELDRAAKCLETLPPQVWLSSRIGVGYARARATEKAAKMLDRMRKDVNPNDGMENSDLHRLEGELSLARGDGVRAVEFLTMADRDKRSPLTVESLARAYQIVGKSDEAITNYETMLAMGDSALGWEPQQPWLGAHLLLAKLYVERKEDEKARRLLQQFLTLWNDADANLPLSQEAQRLSKTLTPGR